MATWANTAEGGTNGADVTTGNSGGTSGDAFSAVTKDPTSGYGTVTYTTTAYQGTRAVRISSTSGSATTAYVATGNLGAANYQRLRWYMRLGALPDTATRCLRAVRRSGDFPASFVLGQDGTVSLRNYNDDIVGGTTNGLPLNTWLRLEAIVDPGSSGRMKFGYALGDGALVETITKTGLGLSSDSTLAYWQLGKVSYTGTWGPFYLDALVADNLGTNDTFIGPLSLNKLRVGAAGVGLRYGTATPGAAYAGTTQIWP